MITNFVPPGSENLLGVCNANSLLFPGSALSAAFHELPSTSLQDGLAFKSSGLLADYTATSLQQSNSSPAGQEPGRLSPASEIILLS
jgi:hypothetical protein